MQNSLSKNDSFSVEQGIPKPVNCGTRLGTMFI
jgi:hypothetical protein